MTGAARPAATRHTQKLKRATPWAIAESIISAGATFVSTLIVARLLDPREFGLAAIAIAVSGLIHSLGVASVVQAFIRNKSVDTRAVDSVLSLVVLMGLAGTGLCWAIGLVLANVFAEPALRLLVAIQGIDCLLLAVAGVPTALLTRKMRTRVLAIRTLGFKIASIAVTMGLAFAGAGAWSIIGGILAGNLVSCVLLWKSQKRWPRFRRPGREMVDLLRLSAWMSVEGGIGALTARGFVLLFGHYHGLAALGMLNFAIRLVEEVGNLITSSVSRVALAFFSAIQRTGGSVGSAFLRGSHMIVLVSAPVLLGIAAIAPDLVPALFGDKWKPAVPAVQLIAVFWSLRMSRILAPAVMRSAGVQRPLATNAILAMVATAIALFLTREGSLAVAVSAYGVRILSTYPVGVRLIARIAGVSPARQLASFAIPFAAATAMAMIVFALRGGFIGELAPPFRIASLVTVGAATYVAILLLADRKELLALARWWGHRK